MGDKAELKAMQGALGTILLVVDFPGSAVASCPARVALHLTTLQHNQPSLLLWHVPQRDRHPVVPKSCGHRLPRLPLR